jgi:hypothetical protein
MELLITMISFLVTSLNDGVGDTIEQFVDTTRVGTTEVGRE